MEKKPFYLRMMAWDLWKEGVGREACFSTYTDATYSAYTHIHAIPSIHLYQPSRPMRTGLERAEIFIDYHQRALSNRLAFFGDKVPANQL